MESTVVAGEYSAEDGQAVCFADQMMADVIALKNRFD